jgi:hypothetical protein
MPAVFPILAIIGVFIFISAHSNASPPQAKQPKSSSEDLAKAFEKFMKESKDSGGAKGKSKSGKS